MKVSIIAFIKTHMMGTLIGIATAVAVGIIVTIAIVSSDEQGEMAILEAGIADIPALKKEDLDKLGKRYSELNEQFEREIDKLTTGVPNRHNLSDNKVNALKHYGVYGQDNPTEFKNDDYVNGIRIKYEKNDPTIKDGASNFNDIIAVMAVMYDQKMDTIDIDKLLEIFETLFWVSHTYTYFSDELYPCKSGCSGISSYKCTDVYKDYSNTALKYYPFTVAFHEKYRNYGQEGSRDPEKDPKEDFKKIIPKGQCIVCGKNGAGCIWDERKTCYHGGSKNVLFAECDSNINFVKEFESYDKDGAHYSESGKAYGELGEDVIPDDIDDMYLGQDDTGGGKLDKTDISCTYYRIVKYCKKRKELLEKIEAKKEEIAKDEYELEDWDSKYNDSETEHSESQDESHEKTYKEREEKIEKQRVVLTELQDEYDKHISEECESSALGKKYWCDGYKVCLGHKTHYKCTGHKIVVCYGHTNINVTIKIMYRDELIRYAFESFN